MILLIIIQILWRAYLELERPKMIREIVEKFEKTLQKLGGE